MKRKWIIGLAAAAVVVVATVMAAVVFLGRVIWTAEDAERQLHAVTYVEEACDTYIDLHREWPGSWEDLAAVTPRASGLETPRDLDRVRERVHVNFQAKLVDIARETPEGFDGFRPVGGVYDDYTHGYEGIIEAAKSAEARGPRVPEAH